MILTEISWNQDFYRLSISCGLIRIKDLTYLSSDLMRVDESRFHHIILRVDDGRRVTLLSYYLMIQNFTSIVFELVVLA